MADCIPYADGDFEAWQDNSITYAGASAAALGLDPLVDIPPLTAAQSTWTNDRVAHSGVQAAAETARQAKDAARGELEGVLPDMGRWKLRNNQFDDICARVGTGPARSKRMASLLLQEVQDGYCQCRELRIVRVVWAKSSSPNPDIQMRNQDGPRKKHRRR